jgi:SAM-dependent methyltransferase
MRRSAPATLRNREPILDVLARVMRSDSNARVLEIASGTGEHAAFLAPRLPVASWQPSDPDLAARASIDAWRVDDGVGERVLPALELDVTKRPWPAPPAASVDLVVCINMIHIAPWEACTSLMAGAAEALVPGGLLFLYGPYKRGGAHTAPSNEAFDESLRSRDPRWGVRDLERVVEEAESRGLRLEEVVEMPANNLSVVLRRASAPVLCSSA